MHFLKESASKCVLGLCHAGCCIGGTPGKARRATGVWEIGGALLNCQIIFSFQSRARNPKLAAPWRNQGSLMGMKSASGIPGFALEERTVYPLMFAFFPNFYRSALAGLHTLEE